MNAPSPPAPPVHAREQEHKDPGAHIAPVWHYLAVLATLLALLTLSAISAVFSLGYWNTIVNLAISVIKTLLVMLFFMHETEARTLTRTTSALGFIWLAILIGIMLTDFLARTTVPAPW